MPVFKYVAKDALGVDHKGEVETIDERQAANLIRRKKLILISIKPVDEKSQKFFEKVPLGAGEKVRSTCLARGTARTEKKITYSAHLVFPP